MLGRRSGHRMIDDRARVPRGKMRAFGGAAQGIDVELKFFFPVCKRVAPLHSGEAGLGRSSATSI